jgi:GlpG protein
MRVIETSLSEDLSLFSRYLWQQRVRHRVFEERGRQVLEVADPAQADAVRRAYEDFRSGQVQIRELPRAAAAAAAPAPGRGNAVVHAFTRYPGLSVLVGLALLASPFSLPAGNGELTAVARFLAIMDPGAYAAADARPGLGDLLGALEAWRWFTPILLHFSVLHLAFNCVIVIELGRRIEHAGGTGRFVLLVLAVAGTSNLAQFAFGGSPLFGGLSGVAYGLLGYVLVQHRLRPEVPEYRLPRGLALGLLAFLVVFTTGITEPFGLYVANVAHWGGLAVGAVAAVVAGRGGARA